MSSVDTSAVIRLKVGSSACLADIVKLMDTEEKLEEMCFNRTGSTIQPVNTSKCGVCKTKKPLSSASISAIIKTLPNASSLIIKIVKQYTHLLRGSDDRFDQLLPEFQRGSYFRIKEVSHIPGKLVALVIADHTNVCRWSENLALVVQINNSHSDRNRHLFSDTFSERSFASRSKKRRFSENEDDTDSCGFKFPRF
ncbi:hypothetical protein [Bufonid herpesvirus 1]|uniref:hypothetical protein n=1 Tax=Bufonid herpesvirus 1 TaxID=2282206 RepID=UPI000EB7226C|nr:hypothetical protein [Bufonid herpesvirus 1]AXF48578.1 hypothetical protein [Bufonid herpesvirus 1]